jgi:hypothetical protein
MTRLLDKAVFYFVPVSEAGCSNPLRQFLGERDPPPPEETKIAILEDAEELLLPAMEARDKVQPLNIAMIPIIQAPCCPTTNVPVTQLDPAIVRPDAIGIRSFAAWAGRRPLGAGQGLELPDQRDYSLAELYCARAETDRWSGVSSSRRSPITPFDPPPAPPDVAFTARAKDQQDPRASPAPTRGRPRGSASAVARSGSGRS